MIKYLFCVVRVIRNMHAFMDLDFHQSERPTARRRRQSEDDGSDRIVSRHEVRVNRDAIEGNEGNEGTTTGEVHLDWKSV